MTATWATGAAGSPPLRAVPVYDDTFTPTGRTTLGDYLSGFWLPRRLPTWAEGTQRYRTWTVTTLLASSLAPRPIEDLGVLEIERYFAQRAITAWASTGEVPKAGSRKGSPRHAAGLAQRCQALRLHPRQPVHGGGAAPGGVDAGTDLDAGAGAGLPGIHAPLALRHAVAVALCHRSAPG